MRTWRRSRPRKPRTPRRAIYPFAAIEQLEDLQFLSATSTLNAVAMPLVSVITSGSASASAQATPLVTNGTPIGHTPAQIAQAYGFNGVTFDNGAIKGNGAGQTIAIVDAYYDPNIAGDLQKFDSQFGLSAPASFTQYVQQGATGNSGWDLETALDVEWAHAMAPGANIVLVEANNSSLNSLMSAVNYARNLSTVSVVSMSWGAGEFAAETQYDSLFTTPAGHIGVTFVASSGDSGSGTTWPSVSPNVLAVGGTSLATGANGSYSSEAAWSGSGGGVSSFETEPTYQSSVQSTGQRTAPDVAYDADPNSGFAVYDSVSYAGQSGWFEVGGTSAGAPQWAALIAIADQGRTLAGQGTLANAQATLYSLPESDFHDVTSGSNGYSATTGYDLVTGRGTPAVNSIVAALSNESAAAAQATTESTATTTTSTAHKTGSTPPSTNPTSPGSPSDPTSPTGPTDPTRPGSSRGVLAAAVLGQPDLAPMVLNGTLSTIIQPAQTPTPAVTSTYVPQVSDRLTSLTSPLGTSMTLTTSVDTTTFASVSTPAVPATSLATDLGTSRLGFSSNVPQLSTGLSRLSFADFSSEENAVEAIIALDGEGLAQAFGTLEPGFVENGFSDAISNGAIDALFATDGWITQATAPIETTSTSSSGVSKTAVAGVATSIGLYGLVTAIRRRRQAAAP